MRSGRESAAGGLVAIGGSSSSGTTLVAAVLDRHSALLCGPELSCLDRRELYERPWLPYRLGLGVHPRRRLEIADVRWRRPLFDGIAGTGVSLTELRGLILASGSYGEAIERFGGAYLARHGKRRWIEKTPTNVFCAGRLLELFPDARFVQVIRDGRDVLVSQLRRGRSLYLSGWIWLCAVAAGYGLTASPRVHTLRYEQLTAEPEGTLHDLLAFLGERFEPSIFAARGSPPAGHVHGTWASTPNEAINRRSVGRYREVLDRETEALFFGLRLSERGREVYGVPFTSVAEALEHLGYATGRTSWPEASLVYRRLPQRPTFLRRLEHRFRGKQVPEYADDRYVVHPEIGPEDPPPRSA